VNTQFYSDRTHGAAPRFAESLPEATAGGLKTLLSRRIAGDCLARGFPIYCSDGNGIVGTNQNDVGSDLAAIVPGTSWPLWQDSVSDETLFDVTEYVGQRVAKPSEGPWHQFFRHHELSFDQELGRAEFRSEVNLLLSRGGTVFELSPEMHIRRVGTPEIQKGLRQLRPATGDETLNGLIEAARGLYSSRRAMDRATAVEKLWDAYERLKSMEVPADKKQSIQALLSQIPDASLRAVVEADMTALTALGNQFQIRHHEVGKHSVPADALDYVAGRMINLLLLLLEQTGRLTP
jgi:hypothetical protein